METGIQNSFIPKDASTGRSQAISMGNNGLAELLSLLSIVFFIASSALAAGIFLYERYTISQITSKTEQLSRAKEAFDPALIKQFRQLDDRMTAAEQILSMHTVITPLLSAIGQSTLQTVSFNSFDFTASDPKHITIRMNGIARSVNSVALQANVFAQSNFIKNPIFSNITRQTDGVHFSVTASLNDPLLSYSKLIEGNTSDSNTTPVISPSKGVDINSAPVAPGTTN